MDQETTPGPEPRREQVKVGVDLGEVEDDENRELREILPDDVHVLFNRIRIVINGPVRRWGPRGQ